MKIRCVPVIVLGLGFGSLWLVWWTDTAEPVFARTTSLFGMPEADDTGVEFRPSYRRSEVVVAVPALALTNQYARDASLKQALDSPNLLALNFVFTSCPTVCPVLSATFAEVQRNRDLERSGLRLVSISIDPGHDSPERLKGYAEKFGAGRGWQFLTGRVEDIDRVLHAFRVNRGEKMNHPQVILLHRGGTNTWVRLDGLVSAEAVVAELIRLGASAADPPG